MAYAFMCLATANPGLMTEIKAKGYNTKHFRKAMKVKEIGYDSFKEDDDEFHMYLRALNIAKEFESVY